MYTEDQLENKLKERLEADYDLSLLYVQADEAKMRIEAQVCKIVHNDKWPKTKAEAAVQVTKKEEYDVRRKHIRDFKVKEMEVARLKVEYYHMRRDLDSWKSLDSEAERMWSLPSNNWIHEEQS